MNCKTCGLPVFHGAVGYAGPMCQCQWKSDAGYHIKQQEQLDLSDSAMTLLQTSIKNTQLFAEAENLRSELAALKAENESLKRDQWKPIDTAPKDGTVFLGYKLGQFRECYKVPRDDCDMWCFGGISGADDLFPNIKPTHWMPLPKAPNGASS